MTIIFIIGFVQAFFICLILINKKNKRLPDKILTLWIFTTGIHLLLYYFHYIDYYQVLPHLLGFLVPLPLVQGPFLLLYVTSLINEDQKISKLFLLHFVPALSYYFFLAPIMLLPAEEKLHYVFEVLPVNSPIYFDVFDILVNISGPVYITWSLILWKKHYRRIKDNFSYTEKINLKWLRNLIIGMATIWLAVLFGNFMDEEIGSVIIFSSVSLYIFLIGYFGARQGVIFTDSFEKERFSSQEVKEKYVKSPLKQNQSQSLLDRLLLFMEEEKPYLESKITLPQLAIRLETNPNYLSQVINEKLNQNLYDFINRYRVEEFKKKLKLDDAQNYTLFGHAQNCGFSSKSSFHEVFKKQTGQTPFQYQSSLL
jgi:AraC-like DNA-binding protein